MKRLVDLFGSLFGLVLFSPILLLFLFLVFLQDFHNPFYIAPRVGRRGRSFRMIKVRSMIVRADQSGVDSTSADDKRITIVGKLIRRYKIDELSQLINVLLGHMSLVGPRPNVQRDVDLYTEEERKLLQVRPGITDYASIVFSDEGDILQGSSNPDLDYNRLIRPWKSRLGLIYATSNNVLLDIQLILLTVVAIINKNKALEGVCALLKRQGVDQEIIEVAKRRAPLVPAPPPGSDTIVTER